MKGFRFYVECVNKRKDARTGDVLAAYATRERDGSYLVCGSSIPGNPVALEHSTASAPYLRTHCTRISEAEARKRNPHLFARLD